MVEVSLEAVDVGEKEDVDSEETGLVEYINPEDTRMTVHEKRKHLLCHVIMLHPFQSALKLWNTRKTHF